MTTHTTDLTATVDAYLAAWSEPDPERRGQLIASAWADDAQLVDPPLTGGGHSGIDAAFQTLQQHYHCAFVMRTRSAPSSAPSRRSGQRSTSPCQSSP